jgi:hypothetical protein
MNKIRCYNALPLAPDRPKPKKRPGIVYMLALLAGPALVVIAAILQMTGIGGGPAWPFVLLVALIVFIKAAAWVRKDRRGRRDLIGPY